MELNHLSALLLGSWKPLPQSSISNTFWGWHRPLFSPLLSHLFAGSLTKISVESECLASALLAIYFLVWPSRHAFRPIMIDILVTAGSWENTQACLSLETSAGPRTTMPVALCLCHQNLSQPFLTPMSLGLFFKIRMGNGRKNRGQLCTALFIS